MDKKILNHKNVKMIYDPAKQAFADAFEVLLRKQKDYGPQNIALTGITGVAVRLNDKIQRLINLIRQDSTPEFESIEDTAIDIMNYGAILLMLIRKQWPMTNYEDKFVYPIKKEDGNE